MKKFSSDFWHKFGEMIGYILIGFSFVGKEVVGEIYSYVIMGGILVIAVSIAMFALMEWKR